MHDLNAVFNPRIHVIQGDNILGLMILDLHEVAHLVVRVRRQLDADLHIDPLIAAGGHKVDLLGIILADIHICTEMQIILRNTMFSMAPSSILRL